MFNHVPFLKIFLKEFDSLLEKWKEYKSNVPTYGAILLDENWDQVGASFIFLFALCSTQAHLSLPSITPLDFLKIR